MVDLQKIREHNCILEGRGNPDQVEWILVDRDNLGQRGGVGVANERATVRLNADTKVSHTNFQDGGTDNVGHGRHHPGVDL